MDVKALAIPDVKLVTPKRFADARGYFSETWNARAFAAAGILSAFMQDNQSLSIARGTVRGLHYQAPPFAQAKLVRVLKGAVLDVAVDARKGSPSYGRHVSARLDDETGAQLFVPQGFLHGFVTLEPGTVVAYKVDAPYDRASDGAVRWNDPDLAIDWGVDVDEAILSEKDAAAPFFRDFQTPF
ncbi:MAG: dTDP-4-dehydrorhamnose 3,5-epimerase [Parvularculaceae bacterium]|nr:dTDP-4-dehydrorhamnose 3,5-epimerase [Parvularculaceae bacterium]